MKVLQADEELYPGDLVALAGRTRFLRELTCSLPVCCYPNGRLFFKGQEHCSGFNSRAKGALSMDLALLLTICRAKVILMEYIKRIVFTANRYIWGSNLGRVTISSPGKSLNISLSSFLYRSTFFYVLFIPVCKIGDYVLISPSFNSYRLKKAIY